MCACVRVLLCVYFVRAAHAFNTKHQDGSLPKTYVRRDGDDRVTPLYCYIMFTGAKRSNQPKSSDRQITL